MATYKDFCAPLNYGAHALGTPKEKKAHARQGAEELGVDNFIKNSILGYVNFF